VEEGLAPSTSPSTTGSQQSQNRTTTDYTINLTDHRPYIGMQHWAESVIVIHPQTCTHESSRYPKSGSAPAGRVSEICR
jgi:hypothetical protein